MTTPAPLTLLPVTAASPTTQGCGCTDGCCDTPTETRPARGSDAWHRQRRTTLTLSWFSLAWMAAEGALGLLAGVAASSIALTGWALGSVIEALASVIVIWRFTGTRSLSETAERRAQRAVAVSFYLLAPYIAAEALHALVAGSDARFSLLGVIVTASSLIVMPGLGLTKRHLARRLGSNATAGEATQNLLCAAQAAAVLVGLLLVRTLGWHWADPGIAMLLAGWAVREGRAAWRGDNCC